MDLEMIWGLVRVVVALAIVLPLTILAARWYGRRQVGGPNLRIKEVLSLGTNRALYLVEWGTSAPARRNCAEHHGTWGAAAANRP